MKTKPILPTLRVLGLSLALTALLPFAARAHPYASCITTNGDGKIYFVMNEGGSTVTVTFDDTSTLFMGVLPRGRTNFTLPTGINGYSISCSKQGNGNSTLFTSDSDRFNIDSTTQRGMAINKNPKIGKYFGLGCYGVGATSGNGLPLGLLLVTPDGNYFTNNGAPVWGVGRTFYAGSGGSGPWRIRCNDDGTYLVNDFSTANACLLQYSPDLSSSNLVLSILGETAAAGAGVHGDMFGTPKITGSLAQGNLKLYTFDSGMAAPADTNCLKGPLTGPGSFNNVFIYNIGSGPLPWSKRPDYAYTMGLDGIAELRTEGDVGPDGKIYCGFGRANASNPNVQILSPPVLTNGITFDLVNKTRQDAAGSPTNWLYTGGVNPPFNSPPNGPVADPWVGSTFGSGSAVGTYAGVRVSPDRVYFASVDINDGIAVASLDNNGIPIESTEFTVPNTSYVGNSRGMDWDAADNIYCYSSGQGLIRGYSLGLTTTCVSSNDWTGTNGTFQLVTPALSASVAVINANASQNYTNNCVNPGAPIAGVFRITLNTSDLTAAGPTFVGFARTTPAATATVGSANYWVNYTMNTNETPNGVIIMTNGVIFPAAATGGGNWSVDVKIIPTAIPVSGLESSVNIRLLSGTNYSAQAPLSGNIAVLNTGPQLLLFQALTATGVGLPGTLSGMNRGIPNDYARFVIQRLGDTNGPGNDASGFSAKSYTVTNINYFQPSTGPLFKANLGVDYTAGAQNFTGTLLSDGSPGVVIKPGAVLIDAGIGNPVKHLNTAQTRTNLSVVINLTNICAGTLSLCSNGVIANIGCNTNLVSLENLAYQVTTSTTTLSEFDNANGGEVVLWSNPLTNAADSVNWTLVHGTIGQDYSPALPQVISNYDNSLSSFAGAVTVAFGKSVNDPGNDGGVTVPQSQTMIDQGWTKALKVSVNKDPGSSDESGVNLYPQIPGMPWNNYQQFHGNYALRFDMFLSLYDFGLNNPTIGTSAREYAAFGINHRGTNANWRLDINPRADGTGSRPINADGEWCSIGAASGTVTPADYDMFISPAWGLFDPTTGAPIGQQVPYNTSFFTNILNANTTFGPNTSPLTNAYQLCCGGGYNGVTNFFANGGVPNDQVSGNNNGFGGSPQNGIIKNPPFQGINKLGGAPDNAWIDVSLELTRQTNLTLKVAQQQVFTSSILLPIAGTQNPIAPFDGTPMLGYIDPNRDISDYSAFVYFSNMRVVELSPFIPWTNQPVPGINGLIVTQGSTFTLKGGAMYASNPLTNIWYRGTTNGAGIGSPEGFTATAVMSSNNFAATSALDPLTVNNIQSGTNYACTWSDVAGSVTSYRAVVEVIAGPGNVTVAAGANTNLTVSFSGNAPPLTYQWKFFGTNLLASTHYSGVTTASLGITNVTAADAGVYSNLVVNTNGSVVAMGTLQVVLRPTITSVSLSASPGNVVVGFMSPNSFDTTSSFVLQTSLPVQGPYTNVPPAQATFTGASGSFQVTAPVDVAETNRFYRLLHVP